MSDDLPRVTRPRNRSRNTRPVDLLEHVDSTPDLSLRQIVAERSEAANEAIAQEESERLGDDEGMGDASRNSYSLSHDDQIKEEELLRRSEFAASVTKNNSAPNDTMKEASVPSSEGVSESGGNKNATESEEEDSKPAAVEAKDECVEDQNNMNDLERSEEAVSAVASAERNILHSAEATGSTRTAIKASEALAAKLVMEDFNEKQAMNTVPRLGSEDNIAADGAVEYTSTGQANVKNRLPVGAERPGAYAGIPGAGYGRVQSARLESLNERTTRGPPSRSTVGLPSMNNLSDRPGEDPSEAPVILASCAPTQPSNSNVDNEAAEEQPTSNGDSSNSEPKWLEKNKNLLLGVSIVLIVVLAVVIVVVVVLGGSGDDSPEVPTEPPAPETLDIDFKLLAELGSSTVAAMDDTSSPQYRAYEWLDGDPNFDTYEIWQKKQRFVLATFYYSLNGPNWKKTDQQAQDWLKYDMNECEWMAYEPRACFEDGSLKFLNITKLSGFKGILPPEMSFFSKLEGIDFSKNIPGSSFEEVFLLDGPSWIPSTLDLLSCEDCRLTGTVPTFIGNFSSLFALLLHGNDLEGTLPTEVGKLTNLHQGYFERNDFSGAIPSEIAQSSNLQLLKFTGNKFTRIPTELGLMTKLNGLYLGENPIETTIPSELGQLELLKHLQIHSTRLQGGIPTEIGRLASLQDLQLGWAGLTGTLPSELGGLTNLIVMEAFDNSFTGPIPSTVGLMASLTQFSLANNRLTSTIPSELGLLSSQLFRLHLFGNSLTGSVPSEVVNLPNMVDLQVQGNPELIQPMN